MSDLTGEVIDSRYQLTGVVASGGMATIYTATDLRLDRQVAVKIMHPHLAQDEKFVERFIREAKAAAALSHPNIVSVLDQGWNQGGIPCVFIVMELVEGATLRDYLHEQGALSEDRVLQLMIPVASALAAAHRLGIVHRDIKPENILVSKEGRIKIADFGLARGALLGTTMTAESSVILGSVSYLSPEQVQRGIADSRSDVYSLGIVIFELLTGEKPFSGDDPVQIAISHVNNRVPAPSSINPKVSPDMDQLVLRSTDVDPDKRPRDCGVLLEELRSLSEKLDPRKRQLSLELDLPPIPLKQPVRERARSAKRIFQNESTSKKVTEESVMAKEKSSSIRKRQLSKRVKRNRRIALAVVAGILISAWYLFAGPGSKVIIPSLAGFTLKDARTELSDLGLEVRIGQKEFSEDVAEGRIIKSDPAGGGRIEPNGSVTVIISKGKERFLVPNLIGLKPEVAQEQIDENKLVVGEVVEEYSSDYAKGLIIRTSPSAGERVKRESVISIFVSKGIEQVAIADYKGKSGEQALTELTEAGFDVDTKFVYSEDLPPGAVISQTPGANEIDKGSKVTLFVSKGSEFVYIPKVVSLPRAQAIGILEDLDLKVIVKRAGGNKSVIRISPSAGTKVKRGSTVTITVG